MLQGGETGRWMLYNKQQSKYNQHAHINTSLQEALLEQALKHFPPLASTYEEMLWKVS